MQNLRIIEAALLLAFCISHFALRDAVADDDEAQLISRAANGDLDAFDALVARHQDKVYGLCLWMLANPDDAGDAAQDAFVRAFRALPRFRGDARFGTWLHRIAVNVCYDASKRRGRQPRAFSQLAPSDDNEMSPDDAPAPREAEPSELLARRERQTIIRAALSTLSPPHRAVLTLFDIEGRSYEEASAVLGVPMGTVKSRLNRARDALRRALEPHRELWDA